MTTAQTVGGAITSLLVTLCIAQLKLDWRIVLLIIGLF